MSFAPLIALIAFAAYLLGSIPFGLLIARSRGIDIRAHGSGNIGATNVFRVLGKKYGLLTFLCDAAKGFLAVVLARQIAAHWPVTIWMARGHGRLLEWFDPAAAGITAALGCILGHSFPIWLRFKGGKGVATSLGVLIGMMPWPSLIIFALWGIIFKISRYVSLASLLAALALPIVVVGFLLLGWMRGWAYFYFAVAAAVLIILRHRSNIQRLLAGTENRFGTPKPAAEPKASMNGTNP
jgi:acyl phosphate:glycerol-3-phosphate acyltransferase